MHKCNDGGGNRCKCIMTLKGTTLQNLSYESRYNSRKITVKKHTKKKLYYLP